MPPSKLIMRLLVLAATTLLLASCAWFPAAKEHPYQFATSWGEKGTGPGQFNASGGVAVAGTGDLYVADFYNQRIQQLRADGTFIRQWGVTGKVGIWAGRFNYPTDVALAC